MWGARGRARVTDDNRRILEPGETARAEYLHWAWQIKFEAAKNTAHHVDKMLHACGGAGYKRDKEPQGHPRAAQGRWGGGAPQQGGRPVVGKARPPRVGPPHHSDP